MYEYHEVRHTTLLSPDTSTPGFKPTFSNNIADSLTSPLQHNLITGPRPISLLSAAALVPCTSHRFSLLLTDLCVVSRSRDWQAITYSNLWCYLGPAFACFFRRIRVAF